MMGNPFESSEEMKVVRVLEGNGFEAFFVGGCVRDFLISNRSEEFKFEDIDVATNASPDEMKKALSPEFKNFNFVGSRFGVLLVNEIEVAQFRSETYKEGSKGKPTVSPVISVKEDAIRRDFTMNSIYMDSKGQIIDFNNGIEDIENKVVRAIGVADERFKEDPSRILRLFYLASRFEFSIDPETLKAAQRCKGLIEEIPGALVGKIIKKVVSQNKLSVFLQMLESAGLFATVFPEMEQILNKEQNVKYHDSDVFQHTIRVIEAAESRFPRSLSWTMKAFTHDIGKGLEGVRTINKEGQPSDLGHEVIGAPLSKELCLRLQFGKKFAEEIEFNTEFHGIRFPATGVKKRTFLRVGRKLAEKLSTKEELIKASNEILDFILLDASGFNPDFSAEISSQMKAVREKFISTIESNFFFVSELPITGSEIIEMMPSKEYVKFTGEILKELLLIGPKSKEETLRIAENAVKRIRM